MDGSAARFFFTLIIAAMLAGSVAVPARAQQAIPDDRAALEQELVRLEQQINNYEAAVNVYQKEGKSLKGEISRLDSQISKTNLQLRAITLELKKLDLDIAKNRQQIGVSEKNLDFNKTALASAIQNLYQTDQTRTVHLLLQKASLSSFFSSVQNLIEVQNSFRLVVQRVERLRDELVEQKEELALRRQDQQALMASRDLQRASLESVKREKSQLLTKTKGEEKRFQELLTVTRQTAAQIRNKIFQFLGGGQLTFGDAYKLAVAAEQATGVRAAFILAVLDRESALGQNVGRCKYITAMHPRRDIPIFLQLMSQLGIDPLSVTVSCANRDGAYGGAMGPAQFIPSTWVLYQDRIAQLTGNPKPSPWRNPDAFMATALYMKDNGADLAFTNISESQRVAKEREAAARYYAGSRWRRYLWTYGERVVVKARQFEEDITELKRNGISMR